MTVETTSFASEGFAPFPNLSADRQQSISATEWQDDRLDRVINEYGEFLQREDIMPRARKMGNEILDLLMFELACRDYVYDTSGLEL